MPENNNVAKQEFMDKKNAFRGLTAVLALDLLSVNIFPRLENTSTWSFHCCQETAYCRLIKTVTPCTSEKAI